MGTSYLLSTRSGVRTKGRWAASQAEGIRWRAEPVVQHGMGRLTWAVPRQVTGPLPVSATGREPRKMTSQETGHLTGASDHPGVVAL